MARMSGDHADCAVEVEANEPGKYPSGAGKFSHNMPGLIQSIKIWVQDIVAWGKYVLPAAATIYGSI